MFSWFFDILKIQKGSYTVYKNNLKHSKKHPRILINNDTTYSRLKRHGPSYYIKQYNVSEKDIWSVDNDTARSRSKRRDTSYYKQQHKILIDDLKQNL